MVQIFLQILGLVVVVLSAIPDCTLVMSRILMHSIIGSGGRLPMLFFLALSTVQIAAICRGNENRILVGNISQLLCRIQITIRILKLCVYVIIFIHILGLLNRHARISFLRSIWIDTFETRC